MADDKDKGAKPKENEKPDEELGDAGKKALDAERKARREAEAKVKAAEDELDKLRADSDASKSDMDKVLEKITKLENRAESAERKVLVAEVAAAKKIPAAIAGRLTGATREELEADADSLIKALDLKPAVDNGDKKKGTGAGVKRLPTENLRDGASNEPDEDDIDQKKAAEIAAQIMT